MLDGEPHGGVAELPEVRDSQVLFEELYHRHRPYLIGFIKRVIKDEADAEDVFHDTLIRYLRFGETVNNSDNIRHWLFAVARHCCFDYLNKKGKILTQQVVSKTNVMRVYDENEPAPFFEEVSGMEAISDHREQLPDVAAECCETVAIVRQALENMPAHRAMYIRMVDILEFSYKDAAEVAGKNDEAFASSLYRARQDLSDRLKRYVKMCL